MAAAWHVNVILKFVFWKVVFLILSELKFCRHILIGDSRNKKLTLETLSFSSKNILLFFQKPPNFLPPYHVTLSRTQLIFAKFWQVPTKHPLNKNFCYCDTTNFWRKIVTPPLRIFLLVQNFQKHRKGLLSLELLVTIFFRHLSVRYLPF